MIVEGLLSGDEVCLESARSRLSPERGYGMQSCTRSVFQKETTTSVFEQAWAARPDVSEDIVVYGKRHKVPRRIALFGVGGYAFSGNTMQPRSLDEVPLFTHAMTVIRRFLDRREHRCALGMSRDTNDNYATHVALVNWYDSQTKDKISSHSDSQIGLVPGYPILCFSFGVNRLFRLKAKRGGARTDIWVRDGDLLIMGGACQSEFSHEIPAPRKSEPITGRRISFTVRCSSVDVS